jgi:AbrB family looped-hinge helix DNA binding protein
MSKITQKGQVTIPKHIRSLLELGPSDEVEFVLNGNEVTIRKKQGSIDNLHKYVGFLEGFGEHTVDEIVNSMRGGPADDTGG